MIKEKTMGVEKKDVINELYEANFVDLENLIGDQFSKDEIEELSKSYNNLLSLPENGLIGLNFRLRELIKDPETYELGEQIKDLFEYYQRLYDFFNEINSLKDSFTRESTPQCVFDIISLVEKGMSHKEERYQSFENIEKGIEKIKQLYKLINAHKKFTSLILREISGTRLEGLNIKELEEMLKIHIKTQNTILKEHIILVKSPEIQIKIDSLLFEMLSHPSFPLIIGIKIEDILKESGYNIAEKTEQSQARNIVDIVTALKRTMGDNSKIFEVLKKSLIPGDRKSLEFLKVLCERGILSKKQALNIIENAPIGLKRGGVTLAQVYETIGFSDELIISFKSILTQKGVPDTPENIVKIKQLLIHILKIESYGGTNEKNSVTGRASGYFQFLPTNGYFGGNIWKPGSYEIGLDRLRPFADSLSSFPQLMQELQRKPPEKKGFDKVRHGQILQTALMRLSAEEQTLLGFVNLFNNPIEITLTNNSVATVSDVVKQIFIGNPKDIKKLEVILYAFVHHTNIDSKTMLLMAEVLYPEIPEMQAIREIEKISGKKFEEFRPGHLYIKGKGEIDYYKGMYIFSDPTNIKNKVEKVIVFQRGFKINLWEELRKSPQELGGSFTIPNKVINDAGKRIRLGEAISIKKGENGAYEVNVIGNPNRSIYKSPGENPKEVKTKFNGGNIGNFLTQEINKVSGWTPISRGKFNLPEFSRFLTSIPKGTEFIITRTETEYIIAVANNTAKNIKIKIA